MASIPPPRGAPPARARVQAATVRLRGTFTEVRFGLEARQRLVMQATPALREVLMAPKLKGWVEFDTFVEATTLVDRLFGKGDLALAREIGRFSADHEIGVWKSLLLRRISPGMLLGMASGVWSHHYDGGRLVSRATGATGLSVRIEGFPQPHAAHCRSIAGWMEGSLALGPRQRIEVAELSCRARGGASCEFTVRWADR